MRNIAVILIILYILCMYISCTSESDLSIVEKYKMNDALENWTYVASNDTVYDDYVCIGDFFKYTDDCLYFFNGTKSPFIHPEDTEYVKTLLRLDLTSGIISPVCADPLCTHSTQTCPFAGQISFFFLHDNKIFYNRSYSVNDEKEYYGFHQFCSYDLDTMEFKIYKQEELVSGEPYGKYARILFHGNYCYYCDLSYDSEKDISIWKIMRLDLDTGSEVYLGDMENENGFVMEYLFIIGDRIYFRDAQSIFSTDLDLNDKQVHIEGRFPDEDIYTDGENIYYSVLTDDKSKSYKLYRCGLDGSEIIDLGIVSTSGWFITTNYIYYTHPNRFELEYAGGGTLPFFYDAIYRCDHDGQNSELVYEAFHRNNENPDNYIQLQNCIAVGNYVFAQYYGVDDKNGNNIIDEGEQYDSYNHLVDYNIMRIDIINQKYELIYPNRE